MSVLDRMKALLRRLHPSWPDAGPTTKVGKEIDSIAKAFEQPATRLDAALDEVLPDTTTQLIERWERVTRNPVRTTDSIETRRARVLAVLRRTAGPRIDQLDKMLTGPLALSVDDIVFVETTREMIELGITQTLTTSLVLSSTPSAFAMGRPWPGLVDDTGVRLYVKATGTWGGSASISVKSPKGTTWTFAPTALEAWYENRTAFLGELAGGHWTVTLTDPLGPVLSELRLLVSNDVDSAQIFNFFVFRDPALSGTPDIAEAQRLFGRTALGHLNAHVIERMAFITGDPKSLCGREPVGP